MESTSRCSDALLAATTAATCEEKRGVLIDWLFCQVDGMSVVVIAVGLFFMILKRRSH